MCMIVFGVLVWVGDMGGVWVHCTLILSGFHNCDIISEVSLVVFKNMSHFRDKSTAALNCHPIILLIRNYGLLIRNYGLLIRNYGLLIRNYGLLIRNCELLIRNY